MTDYIHVLLNDDLSEPENARYLINAASGLVGCN